MAANDMGLYLAHDLALYLAALTSAVLGGWLWFRGKGQEGMRPLSCFSLGAGVWCAAHLMIQKGGLTVADWGLRLLALHPLNPTFFLHFSLRFVYGAQDNLLRVVLPVLYATSVVFVVLGLILGMGGYTHWLEFQRVFVFGRWASISIAYAVLLSFVSYAVLYKGLRDADRKRKRQIISVLITGIWGLFCSFGFLWPTLHIDYFPYTLLLLPTYTLIVVYGVQRYELMAVNRWANRAMVWTGLLVILLTVGALLVTPMARLGLDELSAVPMWQLWLFSFILLSAVMTLQRPVQHVMERLIYPGIRVDAEALEAWRTRLAEANDWRELETQATAILKQHLGQPVEVHLLDRDQRRPLQFSNPAVMCLLDDRTWRCELHGWEGATPGERRVGDLFSTLLAAGATRLAQALKLTEQKRRQLAQQHLTELGGLSAAVAHELRNPLNIISMATTACDQATGHEIKQQINRADHLIQDLLTYTGEIRIQPATLDLNTQLQQALAALSLQDIQIDIDVELTLRVEADPQRLQQILVNLLSNAQAALRGREPAMIHIEAELRDQEVILRLCDNGAGVPADLRDTLFRPFTTRRSGGTGLGLAIVRRLIDAHGGGIDLIEHPGWGSCFELRLPAPQCRKTYERANTHLIG